MRLRNALTLFKHSQEQIGHLGEFGSISWKHLLWKTCSLFSGHLIKSKGEEMLEDLSGCLQTSQSVLLSRAFISCLLKSIFDELILASEAFQDYLQFFSTFQLNKCYNQRKYS